MGKIISTKITWAPGCYVVEPVMRPIGTVADVRRNKLFELADLPSCSPIHRSWKKTRRSGPPSASMKVVLKGATPDAGSTAVARSRPMPLTPDDPSYDAPLPNYQPRYDNSGPLLPFPFFFGVRR